MAYGAGAGGRLKTSPLGTPKGGPAGGAGGMAEVVALVETLVEVSTGVPADAWGVGGAGPGASAGGGSWAKTVAARPMKPNTAVTAVVQRQVGDEPMVLVLGLG